jgi:nucleolar protein 53
MGKRNRRGPFNAVMDPTEFGAGSAMLEVTEAVKESGKYDPWTTDTTEGTIAKVRIDFTR